MTTKVPAPSKGFSFAVRSSMLVPPHSVGVAASASAQPAPANNRPMVTQTIAIHPLADQPPDVETVDPEEAELVLGLRGK